MPRPLAAALGFTVAITLLVPTSYAIQEFTLEEARTRIERLEARVAELEAREPIAEATPAPAPMRTVTGSVAVTGMDNVFRSESLIGSDCIALGASVTVLDGNGNVIGSSRLGGGEAPSRVQLTECTFPFTVEVPETDF